MNPEIRIEKIIHGGLGLGRLPDGMVCMVPYVLPDEIVEVSLLKRYPGYWEAQPEKIIESSEDRVDPPCPYYSVCGGCSLQHMSQKSEQSMKKAIFRDFLDRAGKNELSIEFFPSLMEYHYRNTAVLRVHNDQLGYSERHSHKFVAVRDCLLLQEEISSYLESFDQSLLDRKSGFRVRVGTDGQVVSSLSREKNSVFTVDRLHFTVWIKNFFQVNSLLIPVWMDWIIQALDPGKNDRVLDLYCGSGLLSLSLARQAAHVTGIEQERSAVKRAVQNANENGLKNVYFFSGDTAKMLDRAGETDLVVLDPPRAGCGSPGLVQRIAGLNARKILYSSCEISTFMRDIAWFERSGYRLARIGQADFFPQTPHFEVMGLLVK